MSKAVRFSRYGKLRTDQAVSRTYRELATDPQTTVAFTNLLYVTRTRSNLLARAVVTRRRHLQVEALANLAGFAGAFLRPVRAWTGSRGSMHCVIASLAQHLLAAYSVPKFLASAWFGSNQELSRRKRNWFVSHASGRRFRSLDLPMQMTRKMESVFLQSPDHLTIEQALRRAELLALGADRSLVAAVLATRLGEDLANGDFWRTVMSFFTTVSDELEPHMVGPVIDYLQFVRHERVAVHGPSGVTCIPPPRPDFSMKGRTLASLLRLVEDWHAGLGRSRAGNLAWARSPHQGLTYTDDEGESGSPAVLWELVELTNSTELFMEGSALRHCVASYASLCHQNQSRIWSLRRRRRDNPARPVLTIEVRPQTSTIVQARGIGNRLPTGKALELLTMWARREKLRLAL